MKKRKSIFCLIRGSPARCRAQRVGNRGWFWSHVLSYIKGCPYQCLPSRDKVWIERDIGAVTIFSFFAAVPSFARAAQCANYAKYAAIRSYVNEVPDIDRSNLIAKATLQKIVDGQEQYDVQVDSPCSIDGDDSNCSMEFDVVVKPQTEGKKCVIVSVKDIK